MDDVKPIIAALQKSGFPLQTRVEHEIQVRAPMGWKLLASEHPWRDPDGRDQFIDLIAHCGCVVLVVECKKAQERSLLFLRPLGRETTGLVKRFTFWHIEQNEGAGKRCGTALRDDIELEPPSYCVQFCVATDKSGQRLLEQDARSVVLAADAVVGQFPPTQLPPRSFVVPVIVTTAGLYTLRYQPNEISLDTGGFSDLEALKIEPVSWVRFHKTLTAGLGSRPRTVFVVNSGALTTFLEEISRFQGFGRCPASIEHRGPSSS